MVIKVDTEMPEHRARYLRRNLAALAALLDTWSGRILSAHDRGEPLRRLAVAMGEDISLDVVQLMEAAADEVGTEIATTLGAQIPGDWDPNRMDAYLWKTGREMSFGFAEIIARDAPSDREGLQHLLGQMRTTMRDRMAGEMVTTSVNFAGYDAAQAAGADFKQWKTTSGAPRPEHRALNGQIRNLGQNFSNGLAYPRGAGRASQTANCRCAMVIVKRESS